MKKIIALLLAVVVVSVPAMAQTNRRAADFEAGKAAGASEAKASNMWYAGGFCCGVLGVGAAYVMDPSVPKQGLVGKSPEYTAGYIEGYENKAKKEQTQKAAIGCVAGSLIWLAAS